MRAVSIGTFDGVHCGHMAVVRFLRDIAALRNLTPCIITFNRHPMEVIAPERAPKRIMTVDEEVAALQSHSVEVMTVDFNEELKSLPAAQWMHRLYRDYDARLIVMGYDNTFGCDGRNLDAADYRRLAADTGLQLEFAPVVEGVSSSAVRHAVSEARFDDARKMLGRPFSFSGEVVHGDAIGRTIGFPTANIATDDRQLLPKNGVYATEVVDTDTGIAHKGMMNIGCRPSVKENGEQRVEIHIPGFSGDLYGHNLRITPLRMIREEKKFNSLEELSSQIAKDLKEIS